MYTCNTTLGILIKVLLKFRDCKIVFSLRYPIIRIKTITLYSRFDCSDAVMRDMLWRADWYSTSCISRFIITSCSLTKRFKSKLKYDHTTMRSASFYSAASNDSPVISIIRKCKLDFDGYALTASAVWKRKRLVLTSESLYLLVNKNNTETKLEIVDSIPLHEITNVREMNLDSFSTSFAPRLPKYKKCKNSSTFQSITGTLVSATNSADPEHNGDDWNLKQGNNHVYRTGGANFNQPNSAHTRAMYKSFSRGALKNIQSVLASEESRSAVEISTLEGGYNEGQVEAMPILHPCLLPVL